MSESPSIVGVHRVTRVRTLGHAVPVPLGRSHDGTTADAPTPKTAEEMRADQDARRDAAPMVTSCAADGCPWTHTGTAGECRAEAATHRADVHPELVSRRTYRKGGSKIGAKVDDTIIEEARQRRRDREEADQLEKIERGRAARGESLEEVASAPGGVGAASSSDDEQEAA